MDGGWKVEENMEGGLTQRRRSDPCVWSFAWTHFYINLDLSMPHPPIERVGSLRSGSPAPRRRQVEEAERMGGGPARRRLPAETFCTDAELLRPLRKIFLVVELEPLLGEAILSDRRPRSGPLALRLKLKRRTSRGCWLKQFHPEHLKAINSLCL